MKKFFFFTVLFLSFMNLFAQKSWTADNGNGTYTNPLFYDEFSDPDLIRVGSDFYLAGTTMHCVPGVVVLHSKDLVNWEFLSYTFERFDQGPDFNLENGKDAYGQGIWAPCIRYHNGTFYIFSNINGYGLQVFISKNPAGPWKHINMGGNIHDLSVLFDDNGKIYAVYGYDEVKIIEMKPDFSGYVEGSEKVIIHHGNAMGEGHHIYKIKGKYYIISADYSPMGRMQCARAEHLEGPYETTVICAEEGLGTPRTWGVDDLSQRFPVPENGFKFKVSRPSANSLGCATLHQGGIVELPNGEWWGFSMLDFLSEGRTTCLSPVTWQDGWPYFGLPGNLGRTPRTWLKPDVETKVLPHAPYQRSDNFNEKKLLPIWQWNHNPVDGKWKLDSKKGVLRLNALPANQFLWARNTLTQRCIGPVSTTTVTLDGTKLKVGDIAGLGLLNMPCAWIGMVKTKEGTVIRFYDQMKDQKIDESVSAKKVYLRAFGKFDEDVAWLSYSIDGKTYKTIGDSILLPYQLKTFQGIRLSLFAFNTTGKQGGYAEFDDFTVEEPFADRSKNIPMGKIIKLTNLSNGQIAWANPHGMLCPTNRMNKGCMFRVTDCGKGRVALEAMNGTGYLTITGQGLSADVRMMKEKTDNSIFQWQDLLNRQCMLLSTKTNRYVGASPDMGEPYSADWTGTTPDRKNGTVFVWEECKP